MSVHVLPGERTPIGAADVTLEIRDANGVRTVEHLAPEAAVQLASELVRLATDSIALRSLTRGS